MAFQGCVAYFTQEVMSSCPYLASEPGTRAPLPGSLVLLDPMIPLLPWSQAARGARHLGGAWASGFLGRPARQRPRRGEARAAAGWLQQLERGLWRPRLREQPGQRRARLRHRPRAPLALPLEGRRGQAPAAPRSRLSCGPGAPWKLSARVALLSRPAASEGESLPPIAS
jgi:hypothetical protein